MPISDRPPDPSVEIADSEEEVDVIDFTAAGGSFSRPQAAPASSDAIASFSATGPSVPAHASASNTPAIIPSVVIPSFPGDLSSNEKSKSSTDSQLARARKQAFESSSPRPPSNPRPPSSSHDGSGQSMQAGGGNGNAAQPPRPSVSPVATYRSSATHSGKRRLLTGDAVSSSPDGSAHVEEGPKSAKAPIKKKIKLSSPSRSTTDHPQPPSPASSVDILALEDSLSGAEGSQEPPSKGKTQAKVKSSSKRPQSVARAVKSKAVVESSEEDETSLPKAASGSRIAPVGKGLEQDELPGPSRSRPKGKNRASTDSDEDFEQEPAKTSSGKSVSARQSRRSQPAQEHDEDDPAASDSLGELTPSPEATKTVPGKRGKKRENKKQRKAQLEKWQETVSKEEEREEATNIRKSPSKIRFQVSSEPGTQEAEAVAVEASAVAKASTTSRIHEAGVAPKPESPKKAISRAASTPGPSRSTSRPLLSRGASESPSMIVDKNGNVKGFRTSRTDLPGVVASTGGVKSLGMSRRLKIPSLHTKIKTPPKKKPPLPIKPERKKKDDDDDDDSEEELDEFGRPKIKPGHPDWWKIED